MRPNNKLRGKMKEFELTNTDLAKRLNMHSNTVSNRMTGKEPWRLDEAYALLNMFNVPDAEFTDWFPRGAK